MVLLKRTFQTERRVAARGWEEGGTGSSCLLGIESQVCKMKSSVEGWWGWLRDTTDVLNTMLHCALKNGQKVHVM